MDYKEQIQFKVEMVFRIASQFLSEQLSQADAKNQIDSEMVNIRPAQFEAVKVELEKRLKDAGSPLKMEKLFDLFKNYFSPPYDKLENGHPLRIYYEENNKVRNYLLEIDKMEGEEATLDSWINIYKLIKFFNIHIKRQGENFYSILISRGLRLQVEKTKVLGNNIIKQININEEMLEAGKIIEFLINQRSLTQILADYLDMEEQVLFAKALSILTNQDFQKLRTLDDSYGYVFIDQPRDFLPKVEKYGFNPELILSNLLATKNTGIVYYSLSGEMITKMGDNIVYNDLVLPEGTIEELLNGDEMHLKYLCNEGNLKFSIEYRLVIDNLGKAQGILKIKENISEIYLALGESLKESNGLELFGTAEYNKRESIKIDSSQSIAELFLTYPKFQRDFYDLDDELKGLIGNQGNEILKDATIGMVAKSLHVDLDNLVRKIIKLIESY